MMASRKSDLGQAEPVLRPITRNSICISLPLVLIPCNIDRNTKRKAGGKLGYSIFANYATILSPKVES